VRRSIKPNWYLGWRYSAAFFNKNGKVSEITFRDPIDIDGWLFSVVEGEVDYEYIGEFIEDLN